MMLGYNQPLQDSLRCSDTMVTDQLDSVIDADLQVCRQPHLTIS